MSSASLVPMTFPPTWKRLSRSAAVDASSLLFAQALVRRKSDGAEIRKPFVKT